VKFRIVPLLLALLLAGLTRATHAQDVNLEEVDRALSAKSITDGAKLADQVRTIVGKQSLAKGLRPRVQFVGEDAIVLFAIEAPAGTPGIEFTTDESVFNTRIAPKLQKLGDSGLYAATYHMHGVADPKFPTGVGINYVYTLDKNRVGGEHFEAYPVNPDNQADPTAPKGALTQMPNWKSKIYENTDRTWWVYVPSQYKPEKPACVMIFQDGGGYRERVSAVFDRLIAKGDIPVTVGIFIDPGRQIPGLKAPGGGGERNFEYDTRSDQYSRFLLEEILPEVEKTVKLKHDAASRAVAGLSSGAACAFTCCWYRPDQFSKVLSWIGSYTDLAPGATGIEGTHNYPFLIRRLPDGDPRTKIRTFLQDGGNDLDNPFGVWPLANLQMARAFAFKKMDYKFVYGGGNHSGTHGYAILAESLRWLWRDYPKE